MSQSDRKIILDFLRTQFIMEIATSHKDKPAASIVLYMVDDDFNFYFVTHNDSYKSQNLLNNPRISLAIWKHQEMLVQVDGAAQPVIDEREKERLMDELADAATNDEAFWPPVFRIKGDKYIIFKVTPHWLRSLDLTRNTIRQEDSPFTELTFEK